MQSANKDTDAFCGRERDKYRVLLPRETANSVLRNHER